MTRMIRAFLTMAMILALGACAGQTGQDYGIDSKKLNTLQASLWVDPLGCEHWISDDLSEGYMTARLNRDGTPRCRGGGDRSILGQLPQVRLEMSLWTDPHGCQHWVRDHGAEGYMTQRLDRAGLPVCHGADRRAPTEPITLAADALFDTDKAVLRPQAIAELTAFGQKMQQLGRRNVFVVGHTDARASDDYNLRLSQQRAASVAAFLSDRFQITAQTEGRGEREPVASNETPAGRQANRRVEISILN